MKNELEISRNDFSRDATFANCDPISGRISRIANGLRDSLYNYAQPPVQLGKSAAIRSEQSMDCTRENVGELPLDAFVSATSSIYARHDEKRSLWDIWSHALHHAAAVAEEIRKVPLTDGPDAKVLEEVAHLALWLFTMLGKLKGPIGGESNNEAPQDWLVRLSLGPSDIMWNRYPGICPWCYCATHIDVPQHSEQVLEGELWQTCRCDSLRIAVGEKKKAELRSRAKRTRRIAAANAYAMPKCLDEWQERISALYKSRLDGLSASEVTLHLLEEMGEVSDGLIRMYTHTDRALPEIAKEIAARQIRLEDEFADIISWLFGLTITLGTLRNEKLYLSQIVWDRYGNDKIRAFWCGTCEKAPCACPILLLQSRERVGQLRIALAEVHRAWLP